MQLAIQTRGASLDARLILLIEQLADALLRRLARPVRLLRVSLRPGDRRDADQGQPRCHLNLMLSDRSRWHVAGNAQDLLAAITHAFCELNLRLPAVQAVARAARQSAQETTMPRRIS